MADSALHERSRSASVKKVCQAKFGGAGGGVDFQTNGSLAEKFQIAAEEYQSRFSKSESVEILRSPVEISRAERFPVKNIAACGSSGLVAFGGYAGLIFLARNL
jgi:hypothetical protein